jgi:hypothetical protein
MTGGDILDRILTGLSPVALALLIVTAVVAAIVFVIGFARHGVDFVKHGFKQTALDRSLEKRFDNLEAKIDLIETNHFRHLKNYLGILNGVLLDKEIIDNETKARLDNELRGM